MRPLALSHASVAPALQATPWRSAALERSAGISPPFSWAWHPVGFFRGASRRDAGGGLLLVWPVEKEATVAKGIERGKKDNKPKLSTKEKQKKKKEKNASRAIGS